MVNAAREIIEWKISEISDAITVDEWRLREEDISEVEIAFYKERIDLNEAREWVLRAVLAEMEEAGE